MNILSLNDINLLELLILSNLTDILTESDSYDSKDIIICLDLLNKLEILRNEG